MTYFPQISGEATRQEVLQMLNVALASEIVAYLQYYRHKNDVRGIYSSDLAGAFDEHAVEEAGHAETLCGLIHDLGGVPISSLPEISQLNPDGDVRISTETVQMLNQDLEGEMHAIELYVEIMQKCWTNFPDISVILAGICRSERHHAQELMNLLGR